MSFSTTSSSSARPLSGRRFLLAWAAVVVPALTATATAMLLVDPQGVFPATALDRFDARRDYGTRAAKAEQLRRGPWDVVILGSSRVLVGLDPSDPAWGEDESGARTVFNAGLNATNMVETAAVFDYTLERARPREVVLGADLLMLGTRRRFGSDWAESRFGTHPPSIETGVTHLFGARAIERLIWGDARGHRVNRFGFRQTNLPDPPDHRRLFRATLTNNFILSTDTYNGFAYGQDRVAEVRRVAETCRAKGVRLTLIVAPVHPLQLEVMRGMGLADEFERMKRDLAAIVADVNRSPVPGPEIALWDFTGYTGVVDEPVPTSEQPERRMRWFFESSHFTPALGHRVIRTIVEATPADGFGVRLTPEGIESHLETLRRDRRRWTDSNPAEVAWVADLLERTRAQRERRLRQAASVETAGDEDD